VAGNHRRRQLVRRWSRLSRPYVYPVVPRADVSSSLPLPPVPAGRLGASMKPLDDPIGLWVVRRGGRPIDVQERAKGRPHCTRLNCGPRSLVMVDGTPKR
jgi:hypothetical protein